MKIEICANSYQSALNAQEAGAHRIELSSELSVGGITPSFGLIKQVVKELNIPVFILIRPRSGNFTYSKAEFNIMKHNIQLCKDLGCSGIVSGVLNIDNTIDIKRTKELIQFSKPLPFTFHRAFDWTTNPIQALEQLIDMGVQRILTSGQEITAVKGIELLQRLKIAAYNKIILLPGGGINSENANLFKAVGFSEIHASASTIKQICKTPKISLNNEKFYDETIEVYSDPKKIKSILNKINNEV